MKSRSFMFVEGVLYHSVYIGADDLQPVVPAPWASIADFYLPRGVVDRCALDHGWHDIQAASGVRIQPSTTAEDFFARRTRYTLCMHNGGSRHREVGTNDLVSRNSDRASGSLRTRLSTWTRLANQPLRTCLTNR